VDRTELAWAAGFFDAEGWAAAVKSRRGKRPIAQINQADANGVPEVLTRFRAAVGVGRVRGPKCEEGKVDLYHWVASSRGDVRRTFEAIAPWLGQVKRAQFINAVGPVPSWDVALSGSEHLAWAAGLFDGDGSTYFAKHRTHPGYRTAEIAITQSSAISVPAVLTQFRTAVGGIGHVGGPYRGNAKHEPVYRLKVYRLPEIEVVIAKLRPWLGFVKRAQAEAVIAAVAAQPTLARGSPAWGRNKSHCPRGHEFAAVRKRPYRERVAGAGASARRGHRGCLLCLRDYARHKRLQKRIGGSE
jgi:hypothetical protein